MLYNKLTEEDTKRIDITPAVIAKGWDNRIQIRQELYFTKGRIMVKGFYEHSQTSPEKE